ncbi:MAG: HEAT repeat domain-containing protein [Anaerolineae bacterium]|nr:HEAT repeat domain-containing protein [Anaerolineae bacterium]
MTDIQTLIDMLRNPNASIRTQAIYALGEQRDARAVPPLVQSMRHAEHIATRAAVIRALSKIGGPMVLRPLLDALNDDYVPVRCAAAKALGALGNPEALEPLIHALAGPSALRADAAGALGSLGDSRAVEPLIAVLDNARDDVRCAAAAALGQIGYPDAVPALIPLLDDPAIVYGRTVGETAAESLRQIGTLEALEAITAWEHAGKLGGLLGENVLDVDHLIASLQADDWDTRHYAANILAEVGDVRAVDPLIAVLRDDDPAVRQASARTLGFLGNQRAVEPLIAALDDLILGVRQAAVDALGRLGNARAAAPLITLLADTEADTDFKAANALEAIGTRDALDAVKKWRKALEANPRFPP